MPDPAAILPPNATPLERALSLVGGARLDAVPIDVDRLWNPATCPAALLPWLAWGLSIDIWESDWSEAVKRAAIADAILFQRRKGTPASLRTVLDRFDPLIGVVEWFDDRDVMEPYTFRLDLPLLSESSTDFSEALVAQILRDIAAVKPVRTHMTAVYRLVAEARAWLVSGAVAGGLTRLDANADLALALDPVWNDWLQTENGEPILTETSQFMEA